MSEIYLGDGVKMKVALIPAGKFKMGSELQSKEQPVHEVSILKPFYIGITPVTQAQYEAVTGGNPSCFDGADNPVEQVSWNCAVSFCNKLSLKIDSIVCLPSEAQWEYACRGGNCLKYCFGDDDSQLQNYSWYKENSAGKPHLVGQKQPNDWGLYDMHGNVWEWCSDKWQQSYLGAPTDGSSLRGDGSAPRVLRGGGWNDYEDDCRSAKRFYNSPGAHYNTMGFRVILAA